VSITILQPSAYRLYLALVGATGFFFWVWAAMSALYRIQEVGLNPLQLVLVGTVLEVSAFLFEIPTGVVADTLGRRVSYLFSVGVLAATTVAADSANVCVETTVGMRNASVLYI